MLRTGIPVSVLEQEGDDVIVTLLDILTTPERPEGSIDPDDPSTIPEEWRS